MYLASPKKKKKRGVIGSHHTESLCSPLLEVKIIMSTIYKRWNQFINYHTLCHCIGIGAVGFGIADVQPQHCRGRRRGGSSRKRRGRRPWYILSLSSSLSPLLSPSWAPSAAHNGLGSTGHRKLMRLTHSDYWCALIFNVTYLISAGFGFSSTLIHIRPWSSVNSWDSLSILFPCIELLPVQGSQQQPGSERRWENTIIYCIES